jgi:hypothetical protein
VSIPGPDTLDALEQEIEQVELTNADRAVPKVNHEKTVDKLRTAGRRALALLRSTVKAYDLDTAQLRAARQSAVEMSEYHLQEKLRALAARDALVEMLGETTPVPFLRDV